MADDNFDYDVAVVGGGPTGCSAAVFTARYGLDTVVFDRGRSSLQRCAHLENYLGFPAGIDTETFYELAHDQAREAGCEIVDDFVESVECADEGFVVGTQDGREVRANYVIAATRYDPDYLKNLDDPEMFETVGDDGDEVERFDPDYADDDGRTPTDGLYVASPNRPDDWQAVITAGVGAKAGRAVITDVRRDEGLAGNLARHNDWVRRKSSLENGWKERWRDWFDERIPDGIRDQKLEELREREIERRLSTYISEDEAEERRREAHRRLAEYIDDDALLDAVDDEKIAEYVRCTDDTGTNT